MGKEKDVYREKDENKAERKNRVPAIIGAVTTAILLLAGVVMFGGKVSEMKAVDQENGANHNESSTAETDAATDLDQMEADIKHIILTAHEDMSVKEFNSAAEILKGRLDVLCDGKVYEMEVKEDFIKLMLPMSVLGEMEFSQVMQSYLSREMEYFGYHLGTEKNAEPEYFSIDRSDLSTVTLEYGTVAGVDATLLGEGRTEYPYIKLAFTEKFFEAHGEEITSWGDMFVLAQDVENSSWWYHYLYPTGEENTFCLVNVDDGDVFTELLYYNLTHDSFAEGFYYSTDVNYDAVWEYLSLLDTPGEYQKNTKDITGQTVTIQYLARKAPTEGEWVDTKTIWKNRLDALGEPYAFGMLETEKGEEAVVVKTAADHMGIPVMDLLNASKNDIAIVGGLEKKSIESLRFEKKDDGTYLVYVTVNQYATEDVERILGELKEEGISRLYLTVGSTEWLTAGSESYQGKGTFVFDRFSFRDGELLTDEDEWLIRLLEEICNGVGFPVNFADPTYQLNEDENGTMADTDDFMFSYSDLIESITREIIVICEEATVTANRDTIYVALHQNTGKDFAEMSMELVKEIYENCGFAESGFAKIVFYLLDEKDENRERGRVFFTKSYGISESIPGYVYAAGVFANGRMEEYKDEFKNIVETEPFYSELTSLYGNSWWQFEF